jgi:hypothetical protein
MMRPSLSRLALIALLIVAVPFVTGCSKNPFDPDDDDGGNTLPDNTPPNDTPHNTMLRFEATYEYQVVGEYEKLFTKDFRFTFSSQSDPLLVAEYGNNWGKDDEIESTRHLFQGFTDDEGTFQEAATSITMTFILLLEQENPQHPDSTEHYKLMIAQPLVLAIGLSNDSGFNVEARHEFYLVRGDAAVLDEGQDASTSRWYIYRWDDLSEPISSPGGPRLSTDGVGVRTLAGFTPTTWGAAKATYHR